MATESWRKYSIIISCVILVGAFGAKLGYYQATKKTDKLMMDLLYYQSANNLRTSVKLLDKFRSGQIQIGEESLEKVIDIELSTLALYEKVPVKERSFSILDCIRTAKEYRKKYPQHVVNPNITNSVQKALSLAE